jgi:hypothetical protein
MANVSVNLNTSDWQRAIKALRAKAPARIVRALNRSVTSMQTAMAREVSKDMGIKVGDAKKAMRVQKATDSTMKADVIASGARLPLIAFGAKGPEPSRGKGRGVTARMQGGRNRYPHAFIATMRSGHRGVFQRTSVPGGPRSPIRELKGPSIPHVFNKHASIGLERGEEALVTNLQHEFDYLLQSIRS